MAYYIRNFSIGFCVILPILFAISVAIGLHFFLKTRPADFEVEVPPNGYFGPGKPRPDDARVLPFHVNFSQSEIADLRQRLQAARIGHQELEDVGDWSYGIRLGKLQEWAEYWGNKFDFQNAQNQLNQFPQFTTQLEGIQVHFLHVKPPRPSAYARVVPLLLVHGWPGGIFEFHRIIPMLADPKAHSIQSEIAFELVVPSIPGYGFSEQPHKTGFDAVAAARLFNRLMVERLGHGEYMAQGGDWGSLIVTYIGRLYPNSVRAIHLNMAVVLPFDSARHFLLSLIGSYFPSLVFSQPEHFQHFSIVKPLMDFMAESGYFHLQATKPDTVGVSLNDSPIGLLAYILEKFSTWTNPAFRSMPDGGILKKYTRDELLTIISVYWLRGNILSSQRFYKENVVSLTGEQKWAAKYVTVPTAYAAFPYDLSPPQPRELLQYGFNVSQITYFPDGGHFAALEMPKELANDFAKFANSIYQ